MTTYAFTAPTAYLAYPPNATGMSSAAILPASETSMTTYAGFSVPNNGAVLIHVVQGATTASNLQFIVNKATLLGSSLSSISTWTQALGTSAGTHWIFGPFGPSVFNDSNGLLQATLSSVVSISVGVYILQGAAS